MKSWSAALGVLLAVAMAGEASEPAFVARYRESRTGDTRLLELGWSRANTAAVPASGFSEQRSPESVAEGPAEATLPIAEEYTIIELAAAEPATIVRELLARRISGVPAGLRLRANFDRDLGALADDPASHRGDEVRTLTRNGPPANRIDLVFMGDGYTAAERDKFFADITRLSAEMFASRSLRSYLPLFNVHAVFRASEQSGVGVDVPGKTAYGAFRMGKTLRGIDAPRSGRDAVWDSCHQAPGCDYAILIVNDPNYGGLGGEIAISTSSLESGYKVLVHELGHTIGGVGEEYDGGGYRGANYSAYLDALGWKRWLSGPLREEPAQSRIIAWPWFALTQGPLDLKFTSDGKWARTHLNFSGSGLREPGSLEVRLDGKALPFAFPGWPDGDRQFYDIDSNQGFAAGDHVLTFAAGHPDGTSYLSNLKLHEFGPDYHFEDSNIGAYPLFTGQNSKVGYRPTHEACLMRNMASKAFCPVCLENLWLKLFAKVSLIDELRVEKVDDFYRAAVLTPKLGQLRTGPAIAGEHLHVRWFFDGVENKGSEDTLSWSLGQGVAKKEIEVEVSLRSPEVRMDSESLLVARKKYLIQ